MPWILSLRIAQRQFLESLSCLFLQPCSNGLQGLTGFANQDQQIEAVGLEGPKMTQLTPMGRKLSNPWVNHKQLLGTAAPFLIALGSSWIGLRTWREPFNRASFIATWVITVFVGLLLRRVVFDRGIATAFIIVATITLGVLLGLGRLLSQRLVRR